MRHRRSAALVLVLLIAATAGTADAAAPRREHELGPRAIEPMRGVAATDGVVTRPSRTFEVARLPKRSEPGGGTTSDPSARVAGPASETDGLPFAIETSFTGIGRPADAIRSESILWPSIAVGPEHVIQTDDDGRIVVTDRLGNVEADTTNEAFFGISSAGPIPTVGFRTQFLYDALHARWLALEGSLDCTPREGAEVGIGWLDLAISDTADPTGTWTQVSLGYLDRAPWHTRIGTSSDKVAISGNWTYLWEGYGGPELTCGHTAVEGSGMFVFDWAQLVGSGDTLYFAEVSSGALLGPSELSGRFVPVVQTPATTSTLIVVQEEWWDPAWLGYATFTGRVASGTFDVASVVDLTNEGIVPLGSIDGSPVQPGGSFNTSTYGVATATWQAGRLLIAMEGACGAEGSEYACPRIIELSTSTTPPSLRQDFVIDGETFDGSVPSGTYTGRGDIALTWYRSSATAPDGYLSIMAAYQRASDPLGSLSAPQILLAGVDSSFLAVGPAMAPDPQVPDAVWQGRAVVGEGGALALDSLVTMLRIPPPATFVPIDPVRLFDSRNPLGEVDETLLANRPQTIAVVDSEYAPGAIPPEAVAITANATVVGQTASGYVSITTAPTSTPATSTINFPLGDRRANNLTIPLSSTGTLSAVYKAPTGKKADLILDVTGYFVAGDSGAGYNPIAPVRVLDSRQGIGIGLSGRFHNATPRQLVVTGGDIPAEAVAVTANLTVVGQSGSGYVSVVTDPQPIPQTSNLNFPTHDTRANGLTARLESGALWLVYGSRSGATTDLILDITGYYLPDADGLSFYPLAPGRLLDTRSTTLTALTGRFVSGTPRSLDTDGHWGVGLGAAAITGNLTVTGQTRSGYVSGTPEPDATPSTSTINVPAGDTRANGVTLPLSDAGAQAFVYRGGSGATTHLILDVTGYFR